MRAMLSHASALLYWRIHFPADGELGRTFSISGAEAFAYRKSEIKDCVPETYWPEGQPIDILVLNPRARGKSREVKYHVWSSPIPQGAFYRAGDTLISSPEFVYLQMAEVLSVAQLAALGCELCGTYILEPRSHRLLAVPDDAPRRRFPLTNIDKLRAFLEEAEGSRHLGKALRALRLVVEASRSPMEAVTVLQLCLPPRLGGYGIPQPTMNPVIHLDETARKLAGRRWCEGDACWIDSRLDVEYNGAVHSGAAQMRSDAGRAIALQHMNWTVITITSAQVFDVVQFEAVAKQVAKHLGHRIKADTCGPTPARVRLHEELSEWLDAN